MISIHKTKKHGRTYWVVDLRSVQKGRKFFADEKTAKEFAAGQNREIKLHGVSGASLSERDKLELFAAKEKLNPFGVSIMEAVDYYVRFHHAQKPKLIGRGVEEMIEAKRLAGLRPAYIEKISCVLRGFAQFFPEKYAHEINCADVERWLSASDWKPATRKYALKDVRTFFAYCLARNWCATNPAERVERIVIDDKPPSVLSVDQCRLLMKRAQKLEPSIIPFLALALFCGIRPDEIKRLGSIGGDVKRGLIEISGKASKTRQRRLVTINPTAAAWLRVNSKLPVVNLRRKLFRVRHDYTEGKRGKKTWSVVIPWEHDILRHTAASMMFALYGASKTAMELGHSEQILFSHYRELVTEKDARLFFSILPT